MIAVLALHGVVALVAVAAAPLLRARVFWLCALAPLVTLGWAATRAGEVLDGRPVTQQVRWVDGLGVDLTFRLDGFGLVMLALVSGIGLLVFVYAASYFPVDRHDLARFAPALTLFAGAMLGLVLADGILTLFICWELTSITSYLLIGYEDEKAGARSAALQALLTAGLGGLALLAGLLLVGDTLGTSSLSAMVGADGGHGGVFTAGLVLVLVGCMTKSAQVPFHGWLPRAMAAPTPVSAYLHSATMVKAGVVLLARLSPAVADDAGWWSPTVVTIGVLTMLLGGLRALRATDLKQVLAFGTIGQLGLLFVLFGAGSEATTKAGVVMLVAHALFKAPLFMVVGIVDHTVHSRDLRRFSGLGRALPAVAVLGAVTAASMAGLPPLFGFVGKEKALDTLLELHGGTGVVAVVGVVVGSVLTMAYALRFAWGAFATKRGAEAPLDPVDLHHLHRPGALFLAPAVVLAVACVALGVAPFLLDRTVAAAASALVPGTKAKGLALWHGFNEPLALSAVAVGGGLALFALRRRVDRWLAAAAGRVPSSQHAYEAALKGVPAGGRRVAAVAQSGSLRVYLIVILLTAVGLPGVVLIRDGVWPDGFTGADSPLQWVLLGLIAVAVLATIRVRRRFAAVVLVGAVGYTVSALFVVQGAPDLAVTQVLVETLTVLIFVLVLRHLPERFEPVRHRVADAWKAGVALATGAFVAGFLLLAGGSRTAPTPADDYLATALPEGGGRNVVNVILVDFRGMDTAGEITVLVVCAIGVVGLIQAGRTASRTPGARRREERS